MRDGDAPGMGLLERRPLAEQVGEQLVALIQGGSLRPGDYLPSQQELCRRFGVSRPVLREALRPLVSAGYIDVLNGKGAVIRSRAPDPLFAVFRDAVRRRRGAIADLMEMRQGIETHAAALAARRRSAAQAAQLEAIVAEMRPHLRDVDRYNELDLELHVAIAAATHNAMIRHLMTSLQETVAASIREGFRHRQATPVLARTQELHEDVVRAIVERRAEAAREAMARHFDDVIDAIATHPPA